MSSRLKVVHLSFSGVFGGREKVAFSLVEALAEESDAVLYLVVETRANSEEIADLKKQLQKYKINVVLFETDRLFSRKTLEALKKQAGDDQISVIHAHCHKSILYAVLIKILCARQLKTVLTLHGLHLDFGVAYFFHHILNFLGILAADTVVGCSDDIVKRLRDIPLLSRKVITIRNKLKKSRDVVYTQAGSRKELCDRFGISGHKRLWIGNASRLTQVKNIPLYLHMARRALDKLERDDVLFLLAGEGELHDESLKYAKELGLEDSFIFTGFLSEVDQFYSALDIFVLTSEREGTPMALLEAMGNGLPAVVPAVGGIPDVVVDGKTGILFPSGDLCACTDAVVDLANTFELREKMGRAAHQRVDEEFSTQKWAKEHIACYNKLLPLDGGPI
jgi:glycosyltransferase involved in cell wall biosynthesis